jgi:phenylpropionate dioxygenase-like ring-hydroxylating dioxygenase large terminal subunit
MGIAMNVSAATIGGPADAVDVASLIERDRVHGRLYTDPAVFEQEMARIFYGGWVFVGHDSEIPEAGQYIRRTLGREEVLMVRRRDGGVGVLSNRCAHRGNLICIKNRGKERYLTCAYHGWVYDLEGRLRDVPYPGGFAKDKSEFRLRSLRCETYRGFVFASFTESVRPLTDHLGKAAILIDRACEMSPTGRLRLSAGWAKQRFFANWKMLPENDTDGYHVNDVHASFAQAIDSQYDAAVMGSEEAIRSETRDWGNGHSELDFSPTYDAPLKWLNTSPERFPDYVRSMRAAYGEEKGDRILRNGPPHAVIFPNLFLGEMNIVIFQPVSADESVQWHTPLLLEEVPDELNQRIIRNSEAAMGPSAFLLADDSVISERQQIALRDRADWLDISRGLNRERVDDLGVVVGHVTDEGTNRAFWHQYRDVMTAGGGARPVARSA